MKRLYRRLTWILLMLLLLALPSAGMAATDTMREASATAMVPLRLLAEEAGAKVEWDQATWTATVTLGDRVITVKIGDDKATVGGQPVAIGQATQLAEGRTQVPLGFLREALDVYVTLDLVTGKAGVDREATTALKFGRALMTGGLQNVAAEYSDAFKGTVPMLAMVPAQFAPMGRLVKLDMTGRSANAVHKNVEMLAVFEQAAAKLIVRYTPDGKIDDLHLNMPLPGVPAGAPAYADPAKFIETEVVVGDAPWQLPATLAMPVGDGPFPAVVLVHGSGPNDRDETIMGVKPFRDLAHGLATRGIAVLRYEKRTLEHSQKFALSPEYTVQGETVADAVLAGKLLAATAKIDPTRIYVIGHSQGAMFAPQILKQSKEFAGAVMMAGPVDFVKTLIDQLNFKVKAGELPAEQVAFFKAQLAMLMDPAFDPANPPKTFMLGPGLYWAGFREKASEPLKTETRPVLILQGARDFQVPVNQFEMWKAELGERSSVTYKLYEKLNHIFTEGEGQISTSMEYATSANIPVYVIDDIANWILK